MSAGDRAFDMVYDVYQEQLIEEKIRAGTDPLEAMVSVWGADGLRNKITHSTLHPIQKITCLMKLNEYETRKAVWLSQPHVGGYRDAVMPLPLMKEHKKGIIEKIRSWFL